MTLEDADTTTTVVSESDAGTPADADVSSDEGTPSPSVDTSKTVEGRAQQKWQSIVDADIVKMQRGQFDALNPKTVEMLTKYSEMIRPPRATAPAARSTNYQEPEEADSDPTSYDAIGRKAVAEQQLKEIAGSVEAQYIADEWAEDVRDLFAALKDVPLSDPDWATVDFLDERTFPRSRAGYRAWRKAATVVSMKYLGRDATADTDTDAEATATATAASKDKAKAATTRRPPNPVMSRLGITGVADAARRFRKGELPREEYLKVLNAGQP